MGARSALKRPLLDMVTVAYDKRRHRRVELILNARFMLPDKSEHNATLLNISVGGIALKSDLRPEKSTPVIVYIQELGRLEGRVVRLLPDGFALAYESGTRHRDRLLDKITVKINPDAFNRPGDRVHARHEASSEARLVLPDGREINCRVLDMSFGGVSLAVEQRPKIGLPILIGRMRGRIVRHHDEGIGVAFDQVHTSWGSLSESLKGP